MFRRLIALTSTALITGVLAGCGNTDSWVEAHAADGWPAQYGDAANSSYSDVAGAEALELEWSRSVKGDLGAAAAMGSGHYLSVDNLYIGQPGTMMSFPTTQWIRWRRPVIGMPTTARILAPDHLLVVTHLGQVLLFDAHRGTVIGTPLDLVEGVDPTDSERGLADCPQARPRCPVAAAPAFAAKAGMVVVPVWQPGVPASVLVGLKYNPDRNPKLAVDWTSDAVKAGTMASPVASADGSTIYVNGRDDKLWAINADDGKPKWSTPLKFLAQTPPSVAPSGDVIAGGGPDTRLVAIRDRGDHADVIWTRDDVSPLATSSRAGEHVAYTVVKDGEDGQALLVFDPADGHTVNSYPLPDAAGWPVGVSIGHDRRVVASTSAGQVYGFAPA